MSKDQEWKDRVLLLYVRNDASWATAGVALVDTEMEEVHGERFVLGTVAPSAHDWVSGLRAAVRWDEVAHYLVFDSVAEYERRQDHGVELMKRARDVKRETEPEPS